MKKINVPFTSVSVDPEIQRMREILMSREDAVINEDGTIGRAGDPGFENATNGNKAKTVPKAILSVPEKDRSTRDLINDIRSEDNGYSDDVAAYSEDTIETSSQEVSKKPSIVPKSILSARSVSELIKEMKEEEVTDYADSVATDSEDKTETPVLESSKKPSIVPKSILSAKSVSDLINEMRGIEESEIEDGHSDVEANVDKNKADSNVKLVPKSVLSADQWYERNPYLLEAEKAAMYDFQGKKARFSILRDGRACWQVRCQPSIAGRDKRYCRAYDIALIYDSDHDHPDARYGGSVKAYLLNPTVNQLQDIVNRTNGVTPKTIPHLLRDEKGELYLCTADKNDVSTSIDSKGGLTSAATSLRFALRWINVFELGLIDPVTWNMFQKHGEI